MPLPEQNPERELSLILLSRHLQQHPEQATILALNHYEDFMNLADDYKQLRADFEALQIEYFKLKSNHTVKSVSFPSLPNFSRGNS